MSLCKMPVSDLACSAPFSPNFLPDSAVDAKFERTEVLGEGTYGIVYKAHSRKDGKTVALKQIRFADDDEGIPSTAIREVSFLNELHHLNVVELLSVECSAKSLWLVFEFATCDLRQYIKAAPGRHLKDDELRNMQRQMLAGVDYLHTHRCIHRDIKPQNLLVTDGVLKVADFGLCRSVSVPVNALTREVVTLWYRAPEILLGLAEYSSPVDIWSCGCVFAEMATGKALFPADSEIDLLFRIFQLMGTPTTDVWPDVHKLEDMKTTFPKWKNTDFARVKEQAPHLDDIALNHLRAQMHYNPRARGSARMLLKDPYFHTGNRLYEV